MAKTKAAPKPKLAAAVPTGLLAAVLADPDDDEARRVYANALAQAGDPRGDFIAVRARCTRRQDRARRQSTKPLCNKFRELHSKHSAKWTKPIKALGKQTRWRFHRGFVCALSLDGWDDALTPATLAGVLAAEPVMASGSRSSSCAGWTSSPKWRT